MYGGKRPNLKGQTWSVCSYELPVSLKRCLLHIIIFFAGSLGKTVQRLRQLYIILPQKWQHIQPNCISCIFILKISTVYTVGNIRVLTCPQNFCLVDPQQRADKIYLAITPLHSHTSKTRRTAPTQNTHHHCLGLIICMMSEGNRGCSILPGHRMKKFISHLSSGKLGSLSGLLHISRHIQIT
ncbi:hypothetical protein D3C77_485020 [compost metagenome]